MLFYYKVLRLKGYSSNLLYSGLNILRLGWWFFMINGKSGNKFRFDLDISIKWKLIIIGGKDCVER